MRKVLFFAAAIVAMASCNKNESSINISSSDEIGFFTMAQNETRGYVWENKFHECTNPDSYQAATDVMNRFNSTVKRDSTWRVMQVSAFNVTDGADYFIDKPFASDVENVTKGYNTAIWRATPTMYWPIGKDLEFLTYSSKNIGTRKDVKANWDGAKKVSFDVTPEQCYQNDIVYAQTKGSNRGENGKASSSHDTGLAVKFYHSQAWLTFNITAVGEDSTASAEVADSARIKVDKIVLKNVYNSGVLSFEYDETSAKTTNPKPVATWDFFTQNPTDVEVDDPWNVLDTTAAYKGGLIFAKNYQKVGTDAAQDYNGVQLNMLMPAQTHNEFVLYYTMNGKQNSIELPFTGAFDDKTAANYDYIIGNGNNETGKTNEWKMGFHYIYNITIEINELTFAPTVDMWTMVQGFSPEVQQL